MIGNCRDCGHATELIVYIGPERRYDMRLVFGTWRVDFLCASCGARRRMEFSPEKSAVEAGSPARNGSVEAVPLAEVSDAG